MDPLWLLKGGHEVPGWRALESDARAGEVDVVIFDRDAWALMHAAEAPTAYEGFEVVEPPDGLYVDQNGNSVCVVGRGLVSRPEEVVAALGPEAESMVAETGDVIRALERLGRAF
jgi:hypothetical protein